MKKPDQMHRFIFDESPIRGQHVSLDASWRQIADQSNADGIALTLLGQALTAAVLLVETLKINGNVSLQIRGSGAIHLLMVEATSERSIRGIIRQSRNPDEHQSLSEIFGSNQLVITIKNANAKPHQGIVALSGNTLAEALQAYFDQSEQLPTRLWFAGDDDCVSGLLLQKLPQTAEDTDAWNRITLLAATTEPRELLQLPVEQLLHRLFHEEDLRLFDAEPVHFACSCSPERTREMLLSLGSEEIDDIIATQETISITCEFCNRQYQFDKVDLGLLFNELNAPPVSSTRH